jgi:MazG family protein
MDPVEAANAFREFVAIIQALRAPGTGCPWDLKQTRHTLRRYLVEETHEVLDAIDSEDDRALAEELGDLLLQVVLHAQLAADRGAFTIRDVVDGVAAKMIRRHPHVFGSVQVNGLADITRNWAAIKAAEKGKTGDPFRRDHDREQP